MSLLLRQLDSQRGRADVEETPDIENGISNACYVYLRQLNPFSVTS